MKTNRLKWLIIFLVPLLTGTGCETTDVSVKPAAPCHEHLDELYIYRAYNPVKINIMPLTEIASDDKSDDSDRIQVFVSLLDSFGCRTAAAGVFRFELYEKVVRNSEPKGRRLAIWPDFDLTKNSTNNQHWRDFLRAYEFSLDFEIQPNQQYLLQATCRLPTGKMLLAEFSL